MHKVLQSMHCFMRLDIYLGSRTGRRLAVQVAFELARPFDEHLQAVPMLSVATICVTTKLDSACGMCKYAEDE